MTIRTRVLCTVVALLLTVATVSAHHSNSAYDLQRIVTMKGTVTEMVFTNPHCMLRFDARNDQGEVQHWAVETYNPLYMKRAGWTRTTLKAGDEVTITFHPALNGATNGYIRNGDGKIVFNGRELGLSETVQTASEQQR